MVEKFIELFKGYEGDFGIADMSKTELDSERNKLKPNYEWAGRPINASDYQNHIEGKISIGIQPCRLNKTAQFGCIDIDPKNYKNFKVEHYLSLFQQYKLPLVPLLSKSGGLHCYLFMDEPIPAADLIDGLKSFLLPLGLEPNTEVFPKQKELKEDDKGEIKPGNFINLPYYNNGSTNRYAVDKNNSKLSLKQFIEFANQSKINKEDLNKLVEETHRNILLGTNPEFEDGPPCLALCSKRKLDDGRDRFMYNYMVFAKKKYKDKWPDQVSKANYNYLEDPWDKTKLDSKITAWKKDTAGHTCYEDPIYSKCMRSLCYSRPFGVKSDSITSFPEITDFQIIMYAEPEYRFNVSLPDGSKSEVVAANRKMMTQQKDLLDLIWEQTGIYHEPLKPKDFRATLTLLRKNCQTITPPKGTQINDRLEEELFQYCINGPQAKERRQIATGACLTEEGFHFFRFQSFIDHLGNSWKIPEEKIAQKLKDRCKVEFNVSLNVDGKTVKVCKVKQLEIKQIEHKVTEKAKNNY
tara:strand:- start:1571 stop:3139 length:1569 start_codon:yes stop_codon:yes gene_type:complete